MQIGGLQKTTLLDYPGHLAAIVFTSGCNYRCPFCQNSTLVLSKEKLLDYQEVLDYLKKRKNVLEGVTISGGEPTIQKDLEQFIREVKSYGYDIKLDTNGSHPEVLSRLIDEKLVDYIAMDIKNSFDKYGEITGIKGVDTSAIKKSIDIIRSSNIAHEFRTTIVKEFHSLDDIKNICTLIGDSKYFIQNFEDSGAILKSGLHGWSNEELKDIGEKLKEEFPNVSVRGV